MLLSLIGHLGTTKNSGCIRVHRVLQVGTVPTARSQPRHPRSHHRLPHPRAHHRLPAARNKQSCKLCKLCRIQQTHPHVSDYTIERTQGSTSGHVPSASSCRHTPAKPMATVPFSITAIVCSEAGVLLPLCIGGPLGGQGEHTTPRALPGYGWYQGATPNETTSTPPLGSGAVPTLLFPEAEACVLYLCKIKP